MPFIIRQGVTRPLQACWTRLRLTFACRYSDDEYEYRHVQLPKQMLKVIPKDYFDARGTLKLLWEDEWRALGITQVRTEYTQHPLKESAG
jgi:hypothetical protein